VDAYYNPYYASGVSAATAAAMDHNTRSFYGQASGATTAAGGGAGHHGRSPYNSQDPYLSSSELYLHQQIQRQQRQQQPPLPRGYIPPPPTIPLPPLTPPPPRSSGQSTVSFAAGAGARNPAGTPAKGQDSGALGASPNRGPQVVREEMGRKEAEADDVPLEDVTSSSKVEVS
jgi:hypothetical protein